MKYKKSGVFQNIHVVPTSLVIWFYKYSPLCGLCMRISLSEFWCSTIVFWCVSLQVHLIPVGERKSFIMYRLSNGLNREAAKRTSMFPIELVLTLAFVAVRVRSCGCDSMPIQSPSFGLLWKWPKHSERCALKRKGKPPPAMRFKSYPWCFSALTIDIA